MQMAVGKTTFVSEHLNTDQSQLTECFVLVACFLAVLTMPAYRAPWVNHAKSAKYIVDCLSHVFFETRTHLH